MKKGWFLVVGLALVLAVVSLAGCSEGSTFTGEIKGINISSQQQGIWVTGQGKVTAVPDIATLSLGIEAQDTSVAQAQTRAAGAMESVMSALTKNGVAQKDIQTQQFNIQKVSRWDDKNQQEIVIGYRVTNIVTAKIRQIDKTGTIIDAVSAAGGDLTRIDNIAFSIDDPTAYSAQAREKAIADAKVKAEQIAKLAGVSLGAPTYITENVYFPYPIYRGVAEAAAPAPTTPISPGETEVTLSVQVAYSIK